MGQEGIQRKLKQHETKIARISASLRKLKASDSVDRLEGEIKEKLDQLLMELQAAEATILEISPVKARMFLTKEADNLRKVKKARKKVSRMQFDLQDLDL